MGRGSTGHWQSTNVPCTGNSKGVQKTEFANQEGSICTFTMDKQDAFLSSRGCHKDTHPSFFLFYYGIHSLMFGGYPTTAIGYPPTAIGCSPTAIGYTPTAISHTPTAISYPPTAIVGRIGHPEFFFSHHGTTPCFHVCKQFIP